MKVTVLGCGNVGTAIAFSLVIHHAVNELVLVNRNFDKARGEAADLRHAAALTQKPCDVRAGSLEESRNSDVVVMTMSGRPPGLAPSRNAFGAINVPILKEWIPRAAELSPHAVFVVVTNPVDVATYFSWKLSGLPDRQIIGTGTLIDSARWRSLLSEKLRIHPDDIRAYILGEHGETQFPALSVAFVGGQRIDHDQEIHRLFEEARRSGPEVYRLKGFTNYAIAETVYMIVDSILQDSRRTLPVSVPLHDYYGVGDVCLSVPVIVGRTGVQSVLTPVFTPSEIESFRQSAKHVRAVIDSLQMQLMC